MSHCLLDDEVALVAYKKRTVEELGINVWQQKGDEKIRFNSRKDHTLEDVSSLYEQNRLPCYRLPYPGRTLKTVTGGLLEGIFC